MFWQRQENLKGASQNPVAKGIEGKYNMSQFQPGLFGFPQSWEQEINKKYWFLGYWKTSLGSQLSATDVDCYLKFSLSMENPYLLNSM